MQYIRNMFKRILQKLRDRGAMYVIADPSDSSISFSKALYRHISRNATSDKGKVFMFRILGSEQYAFAVNPELDRPAQLASIQYNTRYWCVGFEALCPTVARMLYDYGMPGSGAQRLPVTVCTTPSGLIYYRIERI